MAEALASTAETLELADAEGTSRPPMIDLTVVSDSNSGIQKLQGAAKHASCPVLHRVYRQVRRLRQLGVAVRFFFIPGHSSCMGNII